MSVCLFVCYGVCLFVSNKRQNSWTDRAQIFCGTSRDSREGLWIIKISNICLHQNSIVIKFFCENPRIIFVRKCQEKCYKITFQKFPGIYYENFSEYQICLLYVILVSIPFRNICKKTWEKNSVTRQTKVNWIQDTPVSASISAWSNQGSAMCLLSILNQ